MSLGTRVLALHATNILVEHSKRLGANLLISYGHPSAASVDGQTIDHTVLACLPLIAKDCYTLLQHNA